MSRLYFWFERRRLPAEEDVVRQGDDADLCAGLCVALAGFIMGAATAEGEEARRVHANAITRIAHAAIDWGAERAL